MLTYGVLNGMKLNVLKKESFNSLKDKHNFILGLGMGMGYLGLFQTAMNVIEFKFNDKTLRINKKK